MYSTTAIVLGRHNLGEADRIMVLLTADRGIIRAVAKGVRRIKSRMAGHLEPFSESQLMLAEGRNMDTITSARLVKHLDATAEYDRMRLAYLFAEMTNRLAGENEHHDGLYGLLRDAYAGLGEFTDPTVELWFKLRLLDRLGYRPELTACTVCQADDPSRSYLFSTDLGGIVDMGCSGPGSLPMTHDQIKLWRLMLSQPLPIVRKVQQAAKLSEASLPIVNAFYDYTFGKSFRSAEVL